MDALKSFIRTFRGEIDDEIGNSSKQDILIIGDFNVNPFEKPMIDFDGFSASNSKSHRKEVTHLRSKKELYYNPTWTMYGKNNFPGTKYFRRPSASSFDILEHHYLDQVVLSYSLSQKLTSESINVLEFTTNKTFFDSTSNSILQSDHLPLIYEFKINTP
jgi:exonuclease III